MKKKSLKVLVKQKSILPTLLILCSLLLSGNALSRQSWNRNYFDVWKVDNTLEISFEVFDYDFGPAGENAYLWLLFCEYSRDGVNFYHFMSVATRDQRKVGNWTWANLSYKLRGAKIQIRNSYLPPAGSLWPEETNPRVEFYNLGGGDTAWLSVIWSLEDNFKDIKYLRISGTWWVNGIYSNDNILKEVYPIDKVIITYMKTPDAIISNQNNERRIVPDQLENKEIRVSKHHDAILVQGARPGEAIQVYTTSGALVESIIANSDLVTIPVSKNQIYFVNVEHTRRKVAM